MTFGGREAPALGPRGEGWVVGQGVLLAAIAASGWFGPDWPRGPAVMALILAVPLGLGGAALAGSGVLRLGSSLTPYPKPMPAGRFEGGGAYRFVRHPIYGGALLLALAWSLVTSPVALAPTVLLAGLFEGKRRREETWLAEAYPEYEAYRARVPRAFVPGVW